MEAFEAERATDIIRDILSPRLDTSRIGYRCMKGYLAINLDGDRYKTICRLYLNNRNRQYLGILCKDKVEDRRRIYNLNEVRAHAESINEALSVYTFSGYIVQQPSSIAETEYRQVANGTAFLPGQF